MFFEKLAAFTKRVDDYLRWQDFRAHRTVGGRLDQWLGIRRHTLPALVLPSLLCALLIMGAPSALRSVMAAVIAIATLTFVASLMRYSDRKNWPLWADLLIQVVPVLLVAGAVWWFGPDQFQNRGVYRHLLVPLAAALCTALLGASLLVFYMFHRFRLQSDYDLYLKDTELFADPGPGPQVTWGTFVTALLTASFRAPLELLTLPAIAALVSPAVWLRPIVGTVLSICFVALFIAGLNERFGTMWNLLQGSFFRGGALLVSLIVIVLGVARVSGVSYVTTVFDTAAWWAVGVGLFGAYLLSWWYDYWANRLLADQILALIQPGAAGTASIPYEIDPTKIATKVPGTDRVLQIHSASRFVAVCPIRRDFCFFQSYTMSALVEKLAIRGAPGGDAIPAPAQIRGRMFSFHVLAALLFVLIIGVPAWRIHSGVQLPEQEAQQSKGPGVSLSTLLMDPSRPAGRPVIVVAASGGGTRAALYTAAVLEGIARTGHGADVVLGSGVSGGGAALAYFAANRPRLVEAKNDADWNRYFDQMKEAYIRDVLMRASEWRMASVGRMGMLLAESFQRHWRLDPQRTFLEQITDFGLILNTSLAGHFDRPMNAPKDRRLKYVEPQYRDDQTSSVLAGGRLILTNLGLRNLTEKALEPGEGRELPIILRSANVRLETAAALNANFPPVFPNAAIDVDDQTRYWVTDGGAVDNRGLEMMLYAIRSAIADVSAARLPPFDIVVADASGYSDHFAQDRGLSPTAGAGTHFASHLDAELVHSIQLAYGNRSDLFHFSYVMMPLRMRASDSFGTHWMLQPKIRVHHMEDYKTISGDEMIRVLRALHSPGMAGQLSPDGCQVLVWSREDRTHQDGWLELIEALGGRDQEPECVLPDGRSAGTNTPNRNVSGSNQRAYAASPRVGPEPLYPHAVTPGKADTLDVNDLTAEWECPSGVKVSCTYSQSHRSVSKKTHTKVYDNYDVSAERRNFKSGEVDHLDPLCNGGSNDIQNLWYQPAKNMWKGNNFGYHEKDQLENWICSQVKAGKLDPKEAFEKITSDWVKYYIDVNPKHVNFN